MSTVLSPINKLFKENDKENTKFWRYMGVAIDRINEYSEISCDIKYKSTLKSLSIDEIEDFEGILGIEENDLSKDDKIKGLCEESYETKKQILILKDFLSRKKKSVVSYYNSVSEKYDVIYLNSPIIQLKQLLEDSILHIISLYTLHNWLNKGTGNIFSLSKSIGYTKALDLPSKESKHFVDELHKKSKQSNNYRVFAYTSKENSKVFVILYRQVNDSSIPDFDEPFRNKEVVPIMFKINTEEGILEVKSKFISEINWIKEYIEENFNTTLTEIKPDLFKEYDSDVVRSAFLEGVSPSGNEIDDFTINKISFRSSPLINSPRVSFALENGDVFPSVKDAWSKDCLDLESIKDIESISFKSHSVRRTIKSTIFDDGNILFSVDDSGMDIETKRQLEDKFIQKFGIPLNKLITNTKFMVGKADVTDYLLTLSSKKELTEIEADIFDKLKKDNIIQESVEENIYCKNAECEYTETYQGDIAQCPSCGYSLLGREKYELLAPLNLNIRSYIKRLISTFCDLSNWELRGEPEKSFYSKNNKYKFFNLVNNSSGESFQILIHQGSIQNKILEKINRSLTPTVIIFVGVSEKHLSKYNNHCIFPVNFGRIYNMSNPADIFKQIYESIEHRSKSYLSSVANKSFEILKNLPVPQEIDKNYSPTDFEDDVFNVLKDIFPNADKWGSSMTGKEVPEGIFTINYNVHGPAENREKYVYSYDCKLNKNHKGYDLAKDEQRKAFDYVEMLNQVSHITRYSTKKQLSSHIFISNNFNENNFHTMSEYFYKKLPIGYDTRPIFLPVDVLVYFHSEYRKNYFRLRNSRNTFMQLVHKALITDKMVIDKYTVDDIISESLDEDLADFKDINIIKVKKGVLDKIKKRG